MPAITLASPARHGAEREPSRYIGLESYRSAVLRRAEAKKATGRPLGPCPARSPAESCHEVALARHEDHACASAGRLSFEHQRIADRGRSGACFVLGRSLGPAPASARRQFEQPRSAGPDSRWSGNGPAPRASARAVPGDRVSSPPPRRCRAAWQRRNRQAGSQRQRRRPSRRSP